MSRTLRLGAFIVAMLLLFAAGIYWIGRKQFLFSSTYRLNAEFENVAGLNGGAEVRVGGIHEGTVSHILLPQHPNEKVRIVMNLARATRDVIKKDSAAAIKSEGLVGEKYVEISFGSQQSPKINDGDTIQGQRPLQISDLIKKTDVILDSAREAVDNVNQTASNLESISSKINQGRGTAGALVNDRKVYQRISAGATAFQEDMEALKHNFFLHGFFKKRGYESSAELTKHEIAGLPAGPVTQKFTYAADKIFDKPDTAKLKEGKVLNDAGTYLQQNSFGVAVVAASTDMKGDTEKNRELTQAQAMVVRDYLVRHFKFDDTRVKTLGVGKSTGVNEGGRVEVLVYPLGTKIAQRRSQSTPSQ